MGHRAVAVPVTGDGTVFPAGTVLYGFSVLDTSGAGNTIKIYANTAASGNLLYQNTFGANAALAFTLGGVGLSAPTGIYVDFTGAVTGSVWVG